MNAEVNADIKHDAIISPKHNCP